MSALNLGQYGYLFGYNSNQTQAQQRAAQYQANHTSPAQAAQQQMHNQQMYAGMQNANVWMPDAQAELNLDLSQEDTISLKDYETALKLCSII